MIISHKYKFIFIKTRKTAGTSIEVFLSQCCSKNDIFTPILPKIELHSPRNYKGIWNPIPEILDSKNHDKDITFENIFKKPKFYNHIPAKLVKNRISREIWETYFKFCVERNPWDKTLSHYYMINDRSSNKITLDNYLDKGNFCTNYPQYTDSDGNLLVDKVIKYENLNNELTQVFKKLGVSFDGSLGVRAKSNHRTNRRSYREILTVEQNKVIEKNLLQRN